MGLSDGVVQWAVVNGSEERRARTRQEEIGEEHNPSIYKYTRGMFWPREKLQVHDELVPLSSDLPPSTLRQDLST